MGWVGSLVREGALSGHHKGHDPLEAIQATWDMRVNKRGGVARRERQERTIATSGGEKKEEKHHS